MSTFTHYLERGREKNMPFFFLCFFSVGEGVGIFCYFLLFCWCCYLLFFFFLEGRGVFFVAFFNKKKQDSVSGVFHNMQTKPPG